MDSPTFRIRLVGLVQKSRKALRLYTSMGRIKSTHNSEFSDMQLAEWRDVNAALLRDLTALLEIENSKKLASDTFILRDRYYEAWREVETDLHDKQKALVVAANQSDFVKAAALSRELVHLKAKLQASQAAHHELQDVISQSKIKVPTIELTSDRRVTELNFSASDSGTRALSRRALSGILLEEDGNESAPMAAAAGGNVIPLRRQ